MYYLYSNFKDVSKYIIDSLSDTNIVKIDDVSKLFEVDAENSLLILHINSYEKNSLELIEQLLKDLADLKILALSNNTNFLEGTKLLQIGVKGYGSTYMHGVHLKQAIDLIMSENVWIYPELANHLIKNITKSSVPKNYDEQLEKLSQHEKECAILVSNGNSNKEIASLLKVQEVTVKKHLSSVYKKFELKNRIELALFLKSNLK